jgi:hypothetical protein
MYDNKELFDLSEMKIKEYNDQTNKKVVLKFKDETNGIPIIEFIGLAPKVYSLLTEDDENKKTAKGIQRTVLKNEITHNDYKYIFKGCIIFKYFIQLKIFDIVNI